MLDQITHLFRLRTILEQGSLRRASEKLNVTQPALSRSLAQLEKYFGQQLVERHARGVKATPFGEKVLSVSNRIERYWEIAEHELRTEVSDEKTVMRIGGGPVWRSGILSSILTELQIRYPRNVIEFTTLTYGKALQDLREGRLDVAFGGVFNDGGSSPRFERIKLTEVTNHVMAREDHPLLAAQDPDISPSSLLAYPWIVYSELPAYREITQHTVAEHIGGMPDIRFICQNLLSVLTILQQSDCLCVLPSLSVQAVNSPRIVPIPLPLRRSTVDIGMIFRTEIGEWGPMKTLLELCRQKFDIIEQGELDPTHTGTARSLVGETEIGQP
ncbi:LysR family transcriptional regulator [Oryzicola mucosus]|uniref:LysR family transcriptional regulator n=1 Tax=Oryzicola mucosus TaxID=2767425 RepID=A0A8J6PTI6_9HYPH|nr:LysR family transcriptional regulator [Oryzicola mucosus]MBD0413177.1 LysR family transcriptional regulator [Oryzicola mucosus]